MTRTTGNVSGIRARLFMLIVLVVIVLTAIGSILAQRHLTEASANEFLSSIEQQVEAFHHARSVRQAVLGGICLDLSRQPRIHAALEDDAIDLLYPSAANELQQVILERPFDTSAENNQVNRAAFYRFLDLNGSIIPPDDQERHGRLKPDWEAQLRLDSIPESQQTAYLIDKDTGKVIEVFVIPIISLESFLPIAALAVGFPMDLQGSPPGGGLNVGVWTQGTLIVPGVPAQDRHGLAGKVESLVTNSVQVGEAQTVAIPFGNFRLSVRLINADSVYPPAYAVFLSSMIPLQARQGQLRRNIFLTAGLLLFAGLLVAHVAALRFARPVEELAVASEAERQQRMRTQAALDSTSRELQRAARFSADASHQLKTPVAVMRAGLEELLVDNQLPLDAQGEVEALIKQTSRLTRVIEDLLLLSRLDAGRLELCLEPVNLRLIVDGLLDDFTILPEHEQPDLQVDVPASLWIQGNRSYTALILQSLLENARKYNRPQGRIQIHASSNGSMTSCRIGNTGQGIDQEIRPLIFERFHRGASGENVPGYGLGLNLAYELTRLHKGDLKLVVSESDWTEFELTLLSSQRPVLEDYPAT